MVLCTLTAVFSISVHLYLLSKMYFDDTDVGVPLRQPQRRSGLATLPSVGAIP